MNNALLIFVRNAKKGKVKTRLAKALGNDMALKIYLALLEHTRKIALAVEADRLLFYSDAIAESDDWPPEAFQKFTQQGQDLGQRMQHAFAVALQTHQKAVIIGSDCAGLTPEIVEAAFRQLDQYSHVIGPALDGGYYLLGMKAPTPTLFTDIPWSTPEVFRITAERIEAAGGSYFLLPELSDIDYAEDWEKYGWEIGNGAKRHPGR